MRPRIGISDRLLRLGNGARSGFFVEELGPYVEWVPYTAEMETGLGALWETWRLTGQGGPATGRHGPSAANALPTPADLDGYVTYTGHDGPPLAWSGRDLFAQRMSAAFPLLAVADEATLDDRAARARFAERVFAAARLRALFAVRWRPRDLVAFHTRHKLQILAHDPARYRQAGRVVARAGSRPPADTETEYRQVFGAALAIEATRGRNVNAMQHAFGFIGPEIDDTLRHTMLERIRAYERGDLPFSDPLVMLARHANGERAAWVARQTYLDPYPGDLRRRLWLPSAEPSR